MVSRTAGKASVGHPVDVATGDLFGDYEDAVLPGRKPLLFARRYNTGLLSQSHGIFGPGWCSPFEMSLWRDLDGYNLVIGESAIPFEDTEGAVEAGQTVRNLGAYHEIRRLGDSLVVTNWNTHDLDVVSYVFLMTALTDSWQLAAIEDASGNAIEIVRDLTGRIAALVQKRERRALELYYDRRGLLTELRLRQTGATLRTYGYDALGRLAETIDAGGYRSKYVYDQVGRLQEETTAEGMIYRFTYDVKGRCIESSGLAKFGLVKLKFEDAAGVTHVTDSLGNISTFKWNAEGQIEQQTSPTGAVITSTFDEHGRLIKTVKASGATWEYLYDSCGDRVKSISPTGSIEAFEFNNHQLTAEIDHDGNRSLRFYDESGRLVRRENPAGETLRYLYDSWGDLVRIERKDGASRSFRYDESGNVVAIGDWLDNVYQFEYDQTGVVVAEIDPVGHRTEAIRDELGRIIEMRHPDGSRRRYSWNALDQPTAYVDETGAVTHWNYSAAGQLIEERHPNGARVQYEYSTIPGQLSRIVNEQDAEHRFKYDATGCLIEETDFSGRLLCYERDADGFVTTIWDHPGARTEFRRDASGRVTEMIAPGGLRTTYEYDARGLLIAADNGECPVTRRFDSLGRMIWERQGIHEIKSEYDDNGNRISRLSSTGSRTDFKWDANCFLTELRVNGAAALHLEYDARRWETARYLAGGVRVTEARDRRGRRREQRIGLGRQSVGQGGGIHRTFDYDPAGRVTTVWERPRGATRISYDSDGRIVEARHGDRLHQYFTYDLADNLTGISRNHEQTSLNYEMGSRLFSTNGNQYEYDSVGRLIRKTRNGASIAFGWDAWGRLTKVRLPDGTEWSYTYDALGRRVGKKGPGIQIHYVWDEDVIVEEIRSGTSTESEVIHWEFDPYSFAPLLKNERGKQYVCVTGAVGEARDLFAADGSLAWSLDATAFGETISETTKGTSCAIRFPGQWYDEETGLHYNRFRYYDPEVGRFISPDPIGLLGGRNPYVYTSSPLTTIDPLGLQSQWVDPATLNFSQRTVTENNYADLMKNGQWDWNRSGTALRVMDVNGQLISYDNRRLRAAQDATQPKVPIQIVKPDEINPQTGRTWGEDFRRRRNDPRNIKEGGPVPPEGLKEKPKVVPCKVKGR